MTKEQAIENIGQSFKVIDLRGGIMSKFDIIRTVDPDGTIHGDFLEAFCEDCRFKSAQPEQLKKKTNVSERTEN